MTSTSKSGLVLMSKSEEDEPMRTLDVPLWTGFMPCVVCFAAGCVAAGLVIWLIYWAGK